MSTKVKKKRPPMSAKKKREKEQIKQTMQVMRAVRMASLLALRNQGWGNKRLRRFNDEFNTILGDVSKGYLSLTDIVETIEAETGLTLTDLDVTVPK